MTNPAPEPATAETALTTTGPAQIVAPELVHAALALGYCVAAARGATPSGAVAVFVDEAGRVLDTATPGDGATDDGAWYWVERWFNPCGHVDYYEQVIGEAHDRLAARTGGRWEQVAPVGELGGYGWFGDVHMVELIAATRGGRHPEFAGVVAQSDTTVRFRVRDGGGVAVFGWRPHDANDTDTAQPGMAVAPPRPLPAAPPRRYPPLPRSPRRARYPTACAPHSTATGSAGAAA